MKHQLAPFARVNHKSLPRAMFVAGAVLLVSLSARPALAQNGLVPALASRTSVQETFRGTVANADERNDTLTIQLRSNGATGDFKVQDGLVFNSVRYGDPVEITVETIDGARTIIGLKKE